jgi:hypothetical protein
MKGLRHGVGLGQKVERRADRSTSAAKHAFAANQVSRRASASQTNKFRFTYLSVCTTFASFLRWSCGVLALVTIGRAEVRTCSAFLICNDWLASRTGEFNVAADGL